MPRTRKRHQPTEADLLEAAYYQGTLPASDPRFNSDLHGLAIELMEAAEETDRVIIRDHYDPKKRHYQVIPRNPWNRPEFREGGLRLGRILDADVYQQEVHPPEVQREYTQRQARGMPKREYTRAARHNYR
jgi:hypothetical protein